MKNVKCQFDQFDQRARQEKSKNMVFGLFQIGIIKIFLDRSGFDKKKHFPLDNIIFLEE